VKELNGEI
jgi:hypothetical protein